MNKYLVGLVYHDPYGYAMWNAGHIEDYESTTGIFINAENEADAIAWGEQIAQRLFESTNPAETMPWKSFDYHCWIEKDWQKSSWNHCFDFFQNVNFGEWPDIRNMGTDAYVQWQLQHGKIKQKEYDDWLAWNKKKADWLEMRK